VTFRAPADSRHDFKTFYLAARERGFVRYPGKLTQVEAFRAGCTGASGPREIEQAIAGALKGIGISNAAPVWLLCQPATGSAAEPR
jgi:2-aminoethylphosphonate-pyruvate transaminase